MSRFLQIALLTLGGALAGCSIHAEGPVPEPEPAGYVSVDYDPLYYDRGWYDHDDWYWHGRDGRLHHEAHEQHDRRMHDRR